jgi:predicted PurR-regulated permease PerM
MPAAPPRKILVPRWVQLVALPVALLGAWQFLTILDHAVFVFVVAALIAILLNPLVRNACAALRLPRGLGVALVYLAFAGIVAGATAVIGTLVADQIESLAGEVDRELTVPPGETVTPAERRLADLQSWLDDHGLERVDVTTPGRSAIESIQELDVDRYTGQAVELAQSTAIVLFEGTLNVILVVVISVYMLLDAPRLARFLRSLFPAAHGDDDLVTRTERALIGYVRGQTAVSLIIGTSAGVSMWLLGALGLFDGGSEYALAFAGWAAVMEVIPYIGPLIGAVPPVLVALGESPTTAIVVIAVYLVIHQIEGHVVIPKLMGQAVNVHPLAVIFALMAGGEIYGPAGLLVALPLLAIGREVAGFLRERVGFERWGEGPALVDVPVEIEATGARADEAATEPVRALDTAGTGGPRSGS